MFNCKMTDELTMATAEEDAQRVYAKKLAADRESKIRKRADESKEQQENRLEADRGRKNRKPCKQYLSQLSETIDVILMTENVILVTG